MVDGMSEDRNMTEVGVGQSRRRAAIGGVAAGAVAVLGVGAVLAFALAPDTTSADRVAAPSSSASPSSSPDAIRTTTHARTPSPTPAATATPAAGSQPGTGTIRRSTARCRSAGHGSPRRCPASSPAAQLHGRRSDCRGAVQLRRRLGLRCVFPRQLRDLVALLDSPATGVCGSAWFRGRRGRYQRMGDVLQLRVTDGTRSSEQSGRDAVPIAAAGGADSLTRPQCPCRWWASG